MLNHLRALAVFARVADAGSFRAAAKRLGISASVVSHHVTSLERHLDTPLIYRTTRRLSLTAAGERLAASAQAMLKAAEDGFGEIGHQSPNPTGSLKITAPAVLQYARFVTRISTFMKRYPKVEISINFSDRRSNIVEEGFDLGIRVGQLKDSSLMSRKLAEGRLIVCASPDYLRARGRVKNPGDLENLELINIVGVPPSITLTSRGKNPAEQVVRMSHRISVDSGFAGRRMAEETCGVVMLPDFIVREAMEAGRLVRVLPGWQAPSFGIYAVWPPNSGRNYLRTMFLDFIAAIAKTEPETDGQMTER